MSAGDIAQTSDPIYAVARLSADDRRFWVAVTCALLVHAALIFGAVRSIPRPVMGQKDGSADGISVEIIDAADLMSKSSVATPGDVPPAAAQEQPTPPQPEPQQPSPPQPQAAQPSTASPQEPLVTASKIEEQTPDLYSLREVTKKPSEPAPPPKAKSAPRPQQDAALRTKVPDFPSDFAGRSAAVARPAGITRSGENDDFGRGVIRALRQTMPGLRTLGRVTIRFLLSDIGNLVEIQVVRSSGDPMLDQNVVFAARQSSFPLPPRGASAADRTFLVTYIYN